MPIKSWLQAVFLGLILSPVAAQPACAQSVSQPKTVLELFTSQGCSSCPAADKLMGKLAARRDIIALSLPVHYWDYLGWKDTLANPKNGDRQRAYAAKRGDREVYTPQMVVNGLSDVVGSDAAKIDAAIERTSNALRGSLVPVAVRMSDEKLIIEAGAAPPNGKYTAGTLWLATVTKEVEVSIRRGENAGKKVDYFNVVRELTRVGAWKGEAVTYTVPAEKAQEEEADLCVLLLQADETGAIIGAAQLALG